MRLRWTTLRSMALVSVAASATIVALAVPAHAVAGHEKRNLATGFCLLADYAAVYSGGCGVTNQRWNYSHANMYDPFSEYWVLRNTATQLCLASGPNLSVITTTCDAMDMRQIWRLETYNASGWHALKSYWTGLYVSTDYSRHVYQWRYTSNQLWRDQHLDN
jgi:hypothetical protein